MKHSVISAIGLSLVLSCASVSAAAPSVVDTKWNLKGKFSGKATVRCAVGGSHGAPIKGRKDLTGTIAFTDGDVVGDNKGRFTWVDSNFTFKTASGTWEQTGGKLEMDFDHWYDSPSASFAFAFAQVPPNYSFSQDGVTGQMNGLKITKLQVSGTINTKGTQITVSDIIGFKFDASASYGGASNACSYSISSLGRTYTGSKAP